MADVVAPDGPRLTLPAAETELVCERFAEARVILEYGSGGSTRLAAEVPGARVLSVESDAAWHADMVAWFAANPPKAEVVLTHADVGPTGNWGMPKGNAKWHSFHRYALDIWDHPKFAPPDVVLIDGRFRTGCFLATLFRSPGPVTVLFDDYTGREAYHEVERYARPVQLVGRMAEFQLDPMAIPPGDLSWIIEQFTRRR